MIRVDEQDSQLVDNCGLQPQEVQHLQYQDGREAGVSLGVAQHPLEQWQADPRLTPLIALLRELRKGHHSGDAEAS